MEETVNFCKLLERCGAKAITVHGRFQEERSRQPNHNDYIREVAKQLTIPIIAKYLRFNY
jgi:tRNA-dihydrouridine synthase